MSRKPPRRSPLLGTAPRSSARITRALAVRPRRQRRGRLTAIQIWTTIGTVLAGLMSVPALVISMNALALGEQQRADALAQRAEDQRQRAAERAQADIEAKTAWARRVTAWAGEPMQGVTVRNASSEQVVVLPLISGRAFEPSTHYAVRVPPCTEMSVRPRLPEGVGPIEPDRGVRLLLMDPADTQVHFWDIGNVGRLNQPADKTAWLEYFDSREFNHRIDTLSKQTISPCT